jgi:hypothetical protein
MWTSGEAEGLAAQTSRDSITSIELSEGLTILSTGVHLTLTLLMLQGLLNGYSHPGFPQGTPNLSHAQVPSFKNGIESAQNLHASFLVP